jgi:hypothetical protein
MDSMSAHAFPLCWPEGWPRTQASSREHGIFRTNSVYDVINKADGLLEELRKTKADGIIVSTSVPLRRDGLPLSKPPVDGDPGAAVYFKKNGKDFVIACDRFTTVESNLRAITLTLSALRGIDRWGSSVMLERLFTGFAALPSRKSWNEVLGVPRSASSKEVQAAYRLLAGRNHPDKGGDPDTFTQIVRAYEDYQSEVTSCG